MKPIVASIACGIVASVVVLWYLAPGNSALGATDKPNTNPLQLAAIADGVVNGAEYHAAMQSMVQCLRDSGIGVSDPEPAPQGMYGYRYLDGAEDASALEVRDPIVQRCYSENLQDVDRVLQTSPEHKDAALALGTAIMRCVEDRKVEFQFSDDQESLIRQVASLDGSGDPVFRACFAKNVGALFASVGTRGGRVDIGFVPLDRN